MPAGHGGGSLGAVTWDLGRLRDRSQLPQIVRRCGGEPVTRTPILALCAAMAFGSSVALQERAAAEVHRDHAMKVGLLLRVARRPLWLIGLVASVAGLILQIAALRHGSLVLVQPVMATTLIFALALVAIRTRVALSA